MPFAPLVGVTRKVNPLQTVVDMVVISGVGLMYTVTVNGLLAAQNSEVGVTV